MTVTKTVMANGSFTLDLRASAPSTVRSAVDIANSAFAHLLVLPAAVDPNAATVANLFAKSLYTGVVFANDDGLTLEGRHATSWLGDPNGVGDVNERTSLTLTYNFQTWLTQILAGQTALAVGTIINIVSGTTMAWDPLRMTPREMFDYVIDYFRSATGNPSIEWQVTDDLKVNGGTVADLYTQTARAFLTPYYDGPDPVCPGLLADLRFRDNVEEYATRELLYYTGGGVGVNGAATPWKDGYGNLVKRKRVDDDSNVIAGTATSTATSIIDRYDQAGRQLTATTTRPAVLLDVPVGSYVYVWDQDKGIYNLASNVPWRGTIATPDLVRVLGITMPVEAGMGVYLVKDGTTVTDLTEWFVPETPGARLVLGALDRQYQKR